ncbi:hypothetical protein PN36_33155 [Candidatus Thiomargarita nelsonii]|uniref:Secreted protein n=1 Tax=Candidatus Thiomargarita nelsonii TaxID=1003181 RepID=A0A4E0RLB1_9GAMM|nr:hypothetical protein PN36_33155 [Candidatus Thiomargarita nelsonii]
MRRFKCWFISTVFLLCGTTAIAQTDLLNLDSYQEGDVPSYGEDIVVQQDGKTGIKYISQQTDAIDTATIKFPVSLSGDFELFIETKATRNTKLFLINSDEYKITLQWDGGWGTTLSGLSAGEDSTGLNQSGAAKNGINKIRFSVVNNVAKVYMNDVFDGKLTLKQDLVYASLIMQNISKIYALTTSGSPTEPSYCTPTEEPTSDDCMATYSLDGKVHIPCISVPDAFGGTTVYDVKMQQQVGTFTFDLELGSVKPR